MAVDPRRDDMVGAIGRLGAAGSGVEARQPDTALTGTVHDLRNALTIVLSGLEQLRRQPLDARGREQFDRVAWGAQQAGRLARALVAPAQGSADHVGIVDLNEAVLAFAAATGQDAGGAAFAMELAPGPLLARIDHGELDRVLLDLVHNAQDALAASGGGQVTIHTAGHRVDGLGGQPTVEVAVSDTGAGMAPDAARHATEAFFSTKGPQRGTGLGLWMARRFAEDADGKLAIETAPRQGTTVRLTLPRAEATQQMSGLDHHL